MLNPIKLLKDIRNFSLKKKNNFIFCHEPIEFHFSFARTDTSSFPNSIDQLSQFNSSSGYVFLYTFFFIYVIHYLFCSFRSTEIQLNFSAITSGFRRLITVE